MIRFRRPKASVRVGQPRLPWHILVPAQEKLLDSVEFKALCGWAWDNRKMPAELSMSKTKPKGWQCDRCIVKLNG